MDPLKEYLKQKKKEALGPFVEQDIFLGYDYVCEALKAANLPEVESEMEI
jgi:hypothetical protein